MEQSTKKLGTSHGIYLGIALILITVLIYAFDVSIMTEWYMFFVNLVLVVTLATMAVKKSKAASTSLFSFKEAFTPYFLTVFIGMLLATVFTLLLFNVIDPEAAETVKELTLEKQAEMLEGFGMTEEQINAGMAEAAKQDTFSLKNIAISFGGQLIFFSIIGLIVALIFREKDKTNA